MSNFARKAFNKKKKRTKPTPSSSKADISHYTDRNILYHDVMTKVRDLMSKRLIAVGKKKKTAKKYSTFMWKQWKERVGDLVFATHTLRDLGNRSVKRLHKSDSPTPKMNKYLQGLGIPETLNELPNPFEEDTAPIGPEHASENDPKNPFLMEQENRTDLGDGLEFDQEEDNELNDYLQNEGESGASEGNIAVAQYRRIQRIKDTFVCHLHHGIISVEDGGEKKEVVFKDSGTVQLLFRR